MRRRSGKIGNGILNATDGHSQGGGVEEVGASWGHNSPRVEESTGRRGGGVVVITSRRGRRGGIESKGLSLRGGVQGRRGLRGVVDSI